MLVHCRECLSWCPERRGLTVLDTPCEALEFFVCSVGRFGMSQIPRSSVGRAVGC